MISIIGHLTEIFAEAIATAYPNLKNAPTVIAAGTISNPKFGDYQCNSAISIAQLLKKDGNQRYPNSVREILHRFYF